VSPGLRLLQISRGAGVKAKTVTNNLPILSVLALVLLYYFTIWVLSAVPDSVNNNLIFSDLIINNVVLNY
jgi:hypothetical protein